jgi:hypothetical protein
MPIGRASLLQDSPFKPKQDKREVFMMGSSMAVSF